MEKKLPYGQHTITEEDITAVVNALKSTALTQGPTISDFEKQFSNYIGSKYAIAVANGTAALHLSAKVLGVKKGEHVITTPITFCASSNCISYCGGHIDFVDIDPMTYLIDLNQVEDKLKKDVNGKYKGIVPVDFTGRAVNLEELKNIAEKYGCWILEDACHAPGGYFVDSAGKTQNCGNGSFADLAIFSFHPVKHIATGEGGMITTNNETLYKKLLKLRTHGISKIESEFKNSVELATGIEGYDGPYPDWYMEMQDLGYNYRITDILCALGISQLKHADTGLARRREIAQIYDSRFKELDFIKGQSGVVNGHAYHLYVIEVAKRLELFNHFRSKNIIVQIHYIPTHLMPYYQQFGWKKGDLPNAEKYYSRCMSLPMYPALEDNDIKRVIEEIILHNEK